jgi:hypothetical protein
MAVTANITYGGGSFTGVAFALKSAHIAQVVDPPSDFLVYQVRVTLPDGTVQTNVGWDNVKTEPDLESGDTPLVQAEAAMKARLTASGATNIVDV